MVMAEPRNEDVKKKPRRPKANAKAKAKKKDSVERIVKLQQRAIDRWSRYTINAAKLTTQGSISPKEWMEQYARLTRGVIEDVGDFVKLVFSRG
jgi:hypothetical protein